MRFLDNKNLLIDKRLSLLRVRAFFVIIVIVCFDIKSRKNDNLLSVEICIQFSNKILIFRKKPVLEAFKAFFCIFVL
jgi:hypothetical protein